MVSEDAEREARIHKQVDCFTRSPAPDSKVPFFVSENRASVARKLGNIFWLPAHRAHTIFLFAYSALFAIPSFTREAQDREPDPDRFSGNRLALTVRTTSSLILDAFGYDLRMNRPREVLYWPAPVIKRAHAEQGQEKRISNAAMAYFAYHHSSRVSRQGFTPFEIREMVRLTL